MDGYTSKRSGPYWSNPPFLVFLTFGHSETIWQICSTHRSSSPCVVIIALAFSFYLKVNNRSHADKHRPVSTIIFLFRIISLLLVNRRRTSHLPVHHCYHQWLFLSPVQSKSVSSFLDGWYPVHFTAFTDFLFSHFLCSSFFSFFQHTTAVSYCNRNLILSINLLYVYSCRLHAATTSASHSVYWQLVCDILLYNFNKKYT